MKLCRLPLRQLHSCQSSLPACASSAPCCAATHLSSKKSRCIQLDVHGCRRTSRIPSPRRKRCRATETLRIALMLQMHCKAASLRNPAPEAHDPAARPFVRQWPSRMCDSGQMDPSEDPELGPHPSGHLSPATRGDPGLKVRLGGCSSPSSKTHSQAALATSQSVPAKGLNRTPPVSAECHRQPFLILDMYLPISNEVATHAHTAR